MRNKKYKKKNKKAMGCIISFFVLFLIFIACQILVPREAGKEKVTIIGLNDEETSILIESSQKQRKLYNTMEEVIENNKEKSDKYICNVHNFNHRDTKILVNIMEEEGKIYVVHSIFFLENNKISSSIMKYRTNLKNGYKLPFFNHKYTEKDKVAQYILKSTQSEAMFKYGNGGKPLYYGISNKKEINSMKILGQKPTDIIPFEYDGQIYYYWYFEGISFVDEIRQRIHKEEFSLEELEMALEIEYVGD